MPIDPVLDPLGQSNPQLRAAQRLAWVEQQVAANSSTRITVPIPATNVLSTASEQYITTKNVEIPGSTAAGAATSAMVSFYAMLTFSGPNSGSPGTGDLKFYFNAFNIMWGANQHGLLIKTDDVGTSLFTSSADYVTAAGLPAARVANNVVVPEDPMGGWVTMPVLAGPTEVQFIFVSNAGQTAALLGGFVTMKMDV